MRSLEKSVAAIFIGSQVAAPWQDGIFYPGVVRSVTLRPMGDTLYTVEFDDRYLKDFTDRQIIGNSHLQNTKDVHLKFNQRVFVTHCEMEVCGYVQKHRKQTNEVFIKLDDSEETLVRKKLEEVRLLSHHNNVFGFPLFDDNYTLNSPCGSVETKKRTVTDGIEVPCAKTQKVTKEEEPAMNEVMAAMILTSLQTASSPSFVQCQPMDCTGSPSPSGSASCSSDSAWSPIGNSSPSPSAGSGHFSWDIQSRGTPSPGLSISDAESFSGPMPSTFHYMPHGTPLESMPGALMFSSSLDEGIDMGGEYGSSVYWDEQSKSPKKFTKASSKTLYKCTWQRCPKTLCTIQGIERHIRTVHLGKKENDFSDHEEEFYYTEVESTMEAFSDTFASMMSSSPPPFQQDSNGNVVSMTTNSTHNHQAAENLQSQAFFPTNLLTQQLKCNSNQSLHHSTNITSVFKAIPCTTQLQKNSKKFQAEDFPRPQYVQQQQPNLHHIASPPTKAQLQLAGLTCNTKIHAEGRKCRKVYGMENRKLWCTQCKWKKACVRFV